MKRVCIIGLGLIGGSLGLALKKYTSIYIVGNSLRLETGEKALRRGAVDEYRQNVSEAVSYADVVFICTPIASVASVMEEVGKYVSPNCIVADTASVKEPIMGLAEKYLSKIQFIGGHPMAGKEYGGIDNAQADLFKNHPWCLVSAQSTTKESVEQVKNMLSSIGATSLMCAADEHDRWAALVSHLPFAVSAALFSSASGSKEWKSAKLLASNGFDSATRLASGDPALHAQICMANGEQMRKVLRPLIEELQRLDGLLEKKDEKRLLEFFKQAKEKRDTWLEQSKNKQQLEKNS